MAHHTPTQDTIYAGTSQAYSISAPSGITFLGQNGLGQHDLIYAEGASNKITLNNMTYTTIIDTALGKINLTMEGYTGNVMISDMIGSLHINVDNSLYGSQAGLEKHIFNDTNQVGFFITDAIHGGSLVQVLGDRYTPGMVTWHPST